MSLRLAALRMSDLISAFTRSCMISGPTLRVEIGTILDLSLAWNPLRSSCCKAQHSQSTVPAKARSTFASVMPGSDFQAMFPQAETSKSVVLEEPTATAAISICRQQRILVWDPAK